MDTGDTAWMLASTALVMLMVPGLAFFYGGMVRAKSVLNIMMMVMYSLAIMPVVWFLWGYSGAFGDDVVEYLQAAEAAVTTYFTNAETRFAHRTRFMDYIWAGLCLVGAVYFIFRNS